MTIRDALEREVERAGDEDLTLPQLVGRATPRLPNDAALADVQEAAVEVVESGQDKAF